jgi:hypothetical protein
MADQPTEIESKLFNRVSSRFSEKRADLLFEQYKIYVELMDKVSERRHQANSFFLTVNTILVTVLTGFIALTQRPTTRYGWTIVAAISGIVFCLTWRRLIHSYSELNKGKFVIIHLLEARLPARLFSAEWDALHQGDGTVYHPFVGAEKFVPLVFAFLYGVLALLMLLEVVGIL